MAGLTFESIDKEIEKLHLDKLGLDIRQESAELATELRQTWKRMEGIVRFISRIPFIPRKWRAALRLLIRTMEGLCD